MFHLSFSLGYHEEACRKGAGSLRGRCSRGHTTPENNTLTAYMLRCMRARNGECTPIDPEVIDVSWYDLIVTGTSLWAFRTSHAVNAAIAALWGAQGKKAVVFATCGESPGETISRMREALARKGTRFIGEMVFTKKDTGDAEKIDTLTKMVMDAAVTS